ncbi:MAG: LysM peptidoglycan-binding domain-containing protein [Solirubrobacteraceae bacterium]
MTVQLAPATGPRGRVSRYLAPIVLAIVAASVIAVVLSASRVAGHGRDVRASQVTARRSPPYWIVQPGDTLAEIAAKTGVSVAELQALNPDVNPLALVPGQRLKLWLHPPKPSPTPVPLGPLYRTVRPGQSFGSIAAQTGINILTLEQLNPGLKSTTFWPGDRVRLRPPLLPSSALARLAVALPGRLDW